MTARIAPASAPFEPEVQAMFDAIMPPGAPPLVLFTTVARDTRLIKRFLAGGLLDRGNVTLRQREIVIAKTTALCGSEYEWGVHVAIFGKRVQFDATQIHSLVHGTADDACWTIEEQQLLRLCESLHQQCNVAEGLWQQLRATFSEPALIEFLMLAGLYRMVSYLTNSLCLPLESNAARFPSHHPSS
jgi:alkylhydroperoxidase family enzyme